MKRKFQAVLHIKGKETLKIHQLGAKTISGITNNPTVFPDPDPTLAELNSANDKLNVTISEKDGSKLKNQMVSDQAAVVFELLKRLLAYVNKKANGDRSIILLSGFNCSDEPVQRDIPDKAVIKRIEDGRMACSAKIYADTCEEADHYKVEISTTPNDPESWKTVLDPASLHKLEIFNLVRGQEIFIRITGGNNRGWGTPSEFVSFIPR
jgi:hypothetical protein